MNLYMLRHGLAEELDSAGLARDSERRLTPKGERKLWQIAQALKALEVSFDLILSSPYVRARQTAEIVAGVLHERKRIEFSDHLIPSGNARKLIDQLHRYDPIPNDVLLVGHEPHLSELISLLVSGRAGFAVVMKKGGLCKLAVESLHYGRCAAIEWLLTPGLMGLMA